MGGVASVKRVIFASRKALGRVGRSKDRGGCVDFVQEAVVDVVDVVVVVLLETARVDEVADGIVLRECDCAFSSWSESDSLRYLDVDYVLKHLALWQRDTVLNRDVIDNGVVWTPQ